MRIVSLLPSATEIAYSLGLQDMLCGVGSDCDYPPEVAQKPVVSVSALPIDEETHPEEIDRLVRQALAQDQPIYRLDRATIQELQPDLILARGLVSSRRSRGSCTLTRSRSRLTDGSSV